ncbi:MAG: DUF4504 domain-containing protein [Gammaproteobacteria bacterium]|jgi:MSHA biogenesis protein MshJ|nr:DUF4504 domain-containing protein [Gammaproteobacteria bacterium]
MQALIIKAEKYIDTLSKRDQMALAIIFIAVVALLWFTLAYTPLSHDKQVVAQDLGQRNTVLMATQAKMQALQQSLNEDPDRNNKELLTTYIKENKRLDQALAKTSTQIINPQEMASLLEQILKSQPELKFISLENKPAIPEFIESRDADTKTADNVGTIYRHSVVLQMEGSYHNAMLYLEKLEKFPWKFFWQEVEIETQKYPNARITLEVYTLGFRKGLIGV